MCFPYLLSAYTCVHDLSIPTLGRRFPKTAALAMAHFPAASSASILPVWHAGILEGVILSQSFMSFMKRFPIRILPL